MVVPSRLLDRELDREVLLGLLGSNVCASASGLVCALGVADQSLVIGAIEVCRGGGEPGLFEILCNTYYHPQRCSRVKSSTFSPRFSSGGGTIIMSEVE